MLSASTWRRSIHHRCCGHLTYDISMQFQAKCFYSGWPIRVAGAWSMALHPSGASAQKRALFFIISPVQIWALFLLAALALSLSLCYLQPAGDTQRAPLVEGACTARPTHTYLPCAGRRDMQARGAWEWQPKTRQIEIRCWPIKNNVWKLLLLCFCCLRRPFFICSACMMIFWSRLHTRSHTEQPQGMLHLGGARAGA